MDRSKYLIASLLLFKADILSKAERVKRNFECFLDLEPNIPDIVRNKIEEKLLFIDEVKFEDQISQLENYRSLLDMKIPEFVKSAISSEANLLSAESRKLAEDFGHIYMMKNYDEIHSVRKCFRTS